MDVTELILASLIPTATIIIGLFWIKRSIPKLMQNVLDDVGAQLSEIFANPTIKKAYSIMGKQSGEVRADDALRDKVADKIIEASPVVGKICEWLDIEPLEGLKLINDPLLAPMIQRFIQGGGFVPQSLSSDFGDKNLEKR